MNVRVARIYLSPGHNFFGRSGSPPGTHPIHEVREVECVVGKGLVGDRFFDFKPHKYPEGYKGQVTFFAWETFEDVSRKLGVPDKPPSAFRRNVITRDVDLNEWIGREFEVQGVRFLGTGESTPCEWMETAFAPGAMKALKGRGGLRARILTSGILRVDEE
jgi:MOSC domain-containing protein YiiM